MKLVFCGDISTWNIADFSTDRIDPAIREVIRDADVVVYNFEGPLKLGPKSGLQYRTNAVSNAFLKIAVAGLGKTQPIVYSSEAIADLSRLNPSMIFCLANNHIKDLGYQGFQDTLAWLDRHNIRHLGAGEDALQAKQHLSLADHVLIGINLVSSRKFSLPVKLYNATRSDYGAAYMSFGDLREAIREHHRAEKQVHLLLHAGRELPKDDPGIDFDSLASLEAETVIIHHPHVHIPTRHESKNIYVVGDFVFRRPGVLPVRRGALVKVDGSTVEKVTFLVQEDGYCKIPTDVADGQDRTSGV